MYPYTERLLDHFGGGYIHYCGNNQHLLAMMPTFEKSIGLNFGNPERHDPKTVLDALAKVRKCFYGYFPGMTAGETAKLARQEDGRDNMFIQAWSKTADQERLLEEFNHAIV